MNPTIRILLRFCAFLGACRSFALACLALVPILLCVAYFNAAIGWAGIALWVLAVCYPILMLLLAQIALSKRKTVPIYAMEMAGSSIDAPRSTLRRNAGSVGVSGRYSPSKLLVALVLLFVFTPFIEDLPRGDLLEALLLTLVMVSSVLAVGGRTRTLLMALVLVIPAVAGKWIGHIRPDLLPPAVFLIPTVVFFGFIVAHLLHFIVRAPRVDLNVLCAGVAGLLMLGLLWVPVYLLVAGSNPNAFIVPGGATLDGFNAFYFSFVTLCTLGYGDVTPVSKVARMLAVTEAITGLFYMAMLISRLVSIYSSGKAASEEDFTGKNRAVLLHRGRRL